MTTPPDASVPTRGRGEAVAQDRGNGFEVRLADVVFSVSAALDMVSPAVVGHHQRVAGIARAIARQINLDPEQTRDLLLAAALHDIGAFSLRERLEIMRWEVEHAEGHAFAGYRLLRSFPPFEGAAEVVRYHHTAWDHGRGDRVRGVPVPLGSHIIHLADRASVLRVDERGSPRSAADAMRTLAAGAGRLFVPELVEGLEAAARPGFWSDLAAAGDGELREDEALGAAPMTEADFRGLARLFWQIVDFRSRFTATHTSGVAAVAGFLAPLAGVGASAGRKVAIAAGLHDLGKLAVPSEILEKEHPLVPGERAAILDHPLHGWRVLGRIPGMEEINVWANFHHERLDGRGYPFGVPAVDIPLESRVVAVADVFTALTEERPYRRGMSVREAIGILGGMAGEGALDGDVVGVASRNREGAALVRRAAQRDASEHYLAFRDQSPATLAQHSAA